jgi:subfamily B ATP-binding cassette protein MsbA
MSSARLNTISGEDIGTIAWFIRRYVRSERWRLIFVGALLAVSAASTAGLAWLIQPVFDRLIVDPNTTLLWLLPAAIIVLVGLNGLALFGKEVMACIVEQNVTARLQSDLFDAIVRADLAHRTGRHTGHLIALCTAFTGKVVLALNRVVTGLTGDIIMVVCLVGVMFHRDWQIALLTIAVIPVIVVGVRAINKRIRVAAEANMRIEGRLTARLADMLGGSKLIKLQGAEEFEGDRFRRLLRERGVAALALTRVRASSTPVFELAGGLGIGMAVAFAAWRGTSGGPSFGTMASIMGALIFAYRPLKRIAATLATIQESLVVARRIRQQLEIQPSIVDRPGAPSLRLETGTIRFEGVWFAYEPNRVALKELWLDIEGGKVTALVGASGAGKSTIANLIPRLYDVDRGAITIDGTDIRDVKMASLRRSIAVVSQETTLFDDTIRANISFGMPDAAETDIVAAAQAANAWQFIETLPEGLDTPVGEHGVRLSGGQRQRLAIARAMLKDAPVLILDEATSSVDSESEKLIQAAFARLMKGRTVILIAHRLSTVIDADKIYVVANGSVAETGVHEKMIQASGPYARIYSLQTMEQAPGKS